MTTTTTFSRFLSKKTDQLRPTDIAPLLDLLPQASLLVDLEEKKIVLANARATEISAFTRLELADLGIDLLFLSNDESIPFHEAIRDIPTNTQTNGFMLVRRGGRKVNVQIVAIPMDARGKWLLLSMELGNVREQKKAEEERLNRVWDMLQTLAGIPQQADIDAAINQALQTATQMVGGDIIAIYQAEGINLSLKRTFVLGSSQLLPEEILPQDLMNLNTLQLWDRRRRPLTRLQHVARSNDLGYLASAPLGQLHACIGLLVTAGHATPPENILEILKVVATNVTTTIQVNSQAVNLRQNLDEQARQLLVAETVSEAIQDGVMILTPDLTILDLNPSAQRALGYTVQEVKDEEVRNILIGSNAIDEVLTAAIRGSHPTWLENIKIFRRNGQPFSASLLVTPVQVSDKLSRILVIFRDLSEKEEYRRKNELLEQRAVLGEVTASFAHEVRNPINNISTGLQLLEYNLPCDDPNLENIRRMQQDCNRLTILIKKGLAFIQPMEYKVESLDLGNLLDNLLASWHHRLERAGIQYQLQVEPALPPVEGDLRALEQVFSNLINNAVEAMSTNEPSRKKALSIKVRRVVILDHKEHAEISISDTGPGIPDDIKDRIFEPFFTTKTGGTGIGLAIVRRILTAHKGTINVTSIPGGTAFQILLPLIKEQAGHNPEVTA